MKILHYSLGLSPYRRGGLTRYATDLMHAQQEAGHEVSMLYPAGVVPLTRLMKTRHHHHPWLKHLISLQNTLPVPLLHGVSDPQSLCDEQHIDESALERILQRVQPDVLHLHTLMGLPSAFLTMARQRHIRIVYTTHDYYGLCLRTNFTDYHGKACQRPDAACCASCNAKAMSTFRLRVCNQPIVMRMKNWLHLGMPEWFEQPTAHADESQLDATHYESLLAHYHTMWQQIDRFHFNSAVARRVFERHLGALPGRVIPITHLGITDRRQARVFDSAMLRVGFVGSVAPYKGFRVLCNAMKSMEVPWRLDVWGNRIKMKIDDGRIHNRGIFADGSENEVYGGMDVLVVPSLWEETFALVVLEALSHGTPVLVSDTVGAQEVVRRYAPEFVYHGEEGLRQMLAAIAADRSMLQRYHRAIMTMPWHESMSRHCEELMMLY